MFVLDTDHATILGYPFAAGVRLLERITREAQPVGISIVTLEEQIRGWLSEIKRHADPRRQVAAYAQFQARIEFLTKLPILPFDEDAADRFSSFRRVRVRIGTMDLKIACIALAQDATLLTRNTADFTQVPGLKFENWLD